MQEVSNVAAVAVAAVTVAGSGFAALRFLIRSYLRELVPNGGNSMADRVKRIEENQTRIHERIDAIYDQLITNR